MTYRRVLELIHVPYVAKGTAPTFNGPRFRRGMCGLLNSLARIADGDPRADQKMAFTNAPPNP